MIIDTHCHLDSKVYDLDLDKVVDEARNLGINGFIIPGADINDLPKSAKIAHEKSDIFFAAGVHPYDKESFNISTLIEFAKDEKCVAIGECGLDYYRLPKDEDEKLREKADQKTCFFSSIRFGC